MNNLPCEQLKIIIDRDRSLIDNPSRCKAFLKDLCGEYIPEINALITAIEERVPSKILESRNNIPNNILLAQLAKNLIDRHSLSQEAAKWAVESWSFALEGVVMNPNLSNILNQSEGSPVSEARTSTPPSPMLAELLNNLGLSQYYPNKLGREEVYTITEYSLADNPSRKPDELSLYYLTNLLALNHQARWLKTDKIEVISSDNNEQSSSDNEDDWLLQTNSNPDQATPKDIHPLDVMAATFLCCNPIIRQDLVLKLWECKLAIPLVIQESEERVPQFFLWAMRGLVMKWKKTQGEQIRSEERTIADYPMDTVSFIRFDRSNLSKSNLLNAVMFGNNPHDIFFHKDSEASNPNRQLAEGSVELAWYLPEEDKDNDFDDITAFANLRGDARKYPQQLKLIGEVSSHVVIFTSIEGLEDSALQIVNNLLDAGKAVILFLTNKEIIPENQSKFQQFMANFKDKSIAFITLVKQDKSVKSQPDIRDEVRNKLKNIKPTASSKISLEDVAKVMQQEMEVDEQDIYCQQGINQAVKILEIVSQHPKEQRKAELLPLQSQCWKKWAQADKEAVRQKQNHLKEDSATYANKQNEHKADSRREQIEIIQQKRLPEVTERLFTALFQEERQVREYFVRQLKLGLDALSRTELPHLYAEYGQKIEELGQYQSSPEPDKKLESEPDKTDLQREQEVQARAKINQELKKIDQQITAQSFGLEHLLREIGQVYLALNGIDSRNKAEQIQYEKLPLIAAELLLSGYPLEIMDGEVSSVPLDWVQAVLTAFIELVQQQGIENPRIFALSAMGIQSSGKSTLLNVMFGLQFAVSAGRCTKGIYLQPVKLSPELREQLQVDYIFVIDTEGIKSPEQSLDTESGHDNELSTFTIGLSDLSLIKVSGENSTYLQDMLPISVQAFLRMREVNLKPKTKIVHRNVDTSSSEKLNRQNVTLNASLDEYTKLACQSEEQPVRAFNKIIEFNLKDDVKYLGNLYQGMASCNPIDSQYSKSVKRLTSEIVYGITSRNISSVDKFGQHLETLWKAVKSENFIYEFKNTIEIQARNKLNTCWSEVVREFGEQVASLVSSAYTEINSCDSTDNLLVIATRYKENLSILVNANWLEQEQKIKNFFEESEGQYENSMNKWQATTLNNLNDLRNRLQQGAEGQVQGYQASRLAELKRRESLSSYRSKIIEDINIFLNKQKQGKSEQDLLEIPEQQLKDEFEKIWKDFLNNITPPNLHPPSISRDAEQILRDSHSDLYSLIISRKNTKPLRECFIQDFNITHEYYKENLREKAKFWRTNTPIIEQEIEILKNSLLNRLKKGLKQREQELIPYDTNYLNQFLDQADKKVTKKIKQLSELDFQLTRECRADLFMIICGEAIRQLEQIDEKWRDAQDPKIAMEKEKKEFWDLFLVGFRHANLQNAVVGTLLNIIQQGIVKKIENDLLETIIGKIRRASKYSKSFKDKQSLIASVMIDLADRENFDDHIEYINYPKTAFEKWIKRNFDNYSYDTSGVRGTIEETIDTLVKMAEEVIKETNNNPIPNKDWFTLEFLEPIEIILEQSWSILDWIKKFSQLKGDRLIIDNLERVERLCSQSPNNNNFIFPDTEISQGLQNVKQQLLNTTLLNDFSRVGTRQYQYLQNGVAERIIDEILGCVEACPFCGEICYQQNKEHEGILHATLNNMHRPKGVRGWRPSAGAPKLLTEICSQLVAGDRSFYKNHNDDYTTPYKQYRNVYPDWDIKGDLSMETDAYWKWFMHKYSNELAKIYSAEESDTPKAWESITKQQATEKLCQILDGKA